MINIIVNGVSLDLYPTNLSYKRVNNAFTFGKLTLSRTQNFKMPKSPKNLGVLGVGSVQVYGEQERRYFDAQLQGSGFVENGLLYIDSIDENFNCIFLFGSLFVLKNLSQVKKLADIIEDLDEIVRIPQEGKNANATDLGIYDFVKYVNNDTKVMPSVGVRDLFTNANSQFENIINIDTIPNYRIIQQGNGDIKKVNVVFSKTSVTTFGENQLKLLFNELNTYYTYSETGVRGEYTEAGIAKFQCKFDTELTFAEDFPDDIFVVKDNSNIASDGFVNINVEFFGGYEFDTAVREVSSLSEEGERATSGEPLAGRSITIPAATLFSFYRKSNFHNTTNKPRENTYYNHYRGFFGGDASPFTYTLPEVKVTDKVVIYDEFTSFINNLPDMSYIDLLTTVAILAGKYVTYNATSRKIELVNYADINELVELKNVISMGKINRVGITEARSNKILPAENKAVSVNNVNIIDYITDNDTLEAEEVIKELKLSTGNNINGTLYIYDVVKNGNLYEFPTDVPLIAEAGENENLQFIKMQNNDLLNSVYEKSTKIEVNSYMTMAEFMTIKETNTFLYKNVKWVWISGQWQKDKAKFVLQKI